MRPAWWCFVAAIVTAASTTAAQAAAEAPSLSDDVMRHIEDIRLRNPELREDTFSKMGGSSVVSKAFLTCFATDHVDLGDHMKLQETIELFGTGRENPFRRKSEAAGVSWNLRYVLGGKPANFREELRVTNARWALVLFGSNDAQNENERVYFERLVYLVEEMTKLGVVPILGSASPRRDRHRNRWIDRFNLITEAVAQHWSLPYVDYNAALMKLPRKGLARDGVHPNVLPPGGTRNACVLTEEGLRYGNNVRNLLTLQTLAELVSRTGTVAGPVSVVDLDPVTGPEPIAEAAPRVAEHDPPADGPVPTDLDPISVPEPDLRAVPLSLLLDKPSLPPASPLPKSCGLAKAGARHHVISFTVEERTRLRVSALDLEGRRPRVLLVQRREEAPSRCVRRRLQTLEVDVAPGMWDLVVEVSPAAAEEGKLLLLVAREPR